MFLKSEYFNVTDVNTNIVKNLNCLDVDKLFEFIIDKIKDKNLELNKFEIKDKLSLFVKSKIKSKVK